MTSQELYQRLVDHLKQVGPTALAFSGGVDSTLLMQAAFDAYGDKALAITVLTPYIPRWEYKEAVELAERIGITHKILEADIPDEIKSNPSDRCYLCKRVLFRKITELSKEAGFDRVMDGSNFDDTKDYRPGMKALGELKVISPLLELKITKDEVRQMSKLLDLPTWDKPAYACLLTRIPYHTPFEASDFEMIEAAEVYMMSQGFRAVRVRKHIDLARVEVAQNDLHKLMDQNLLRQIDAKLKEIGFTYVTLDMKGYEVGSFNKTLSEQELNYES